MKAQSVTLGGGLSAPMSWLMAPAALLLPLLLSPVPNAEAGWLCDTDLNSPVCTASTNQDYPHAVSQGEDGVIVVWRNWSDPAAPDVYAQHLLVSGNVDAVWPPDGLPVCTEANRQESIVVVSDGAGGAFVAWDDSRSGEYQERVYVHHVLANGTLDLAWPESGSPAAPSENQQLQPRLQPDGSGGVYVTWYGTAGSAGYNVYAQHFFRNGTVDPDWNEGGIYVCPANGDQTSHAVTTDGSGGMIVAWVDARSGSEADIYAQHILPTGLRDPNWPSSGRAICTESGYQYSPCIVSDDAGGAIIAWDDGRDSGDSYIYAQHLLWDGQVDPAWPVDGRQLCPEPGGQSFPVIVTDDLGGAVVAWQDGRSLFPGYDIYAQRVLASGSIDPAWPTAGLAVCDVAEDQSSPAMIPWGFGGVLITWQDRRNTSDYDIYAQRILPTGVVDPAWPADGLPVSTAANSQSRPTIARTGENHAAVIWTDNRAGGSQTDLYAQLILADGTIDDYMEDNDFCGSDFPLSAGEYAGLITRSTDLDWFSITVPRSSEVVITANFVHAYGDIDIVLYDAACSTILDQSTGSTDVEVVSYMNTGPTTEVHLSVYPFLPGCNGYALSIEYVGSSNLNAQNTISGWYGPAVPRNQPGATPGNVQPTPILDGNATTTYFNYSTFAEGPLNLPEWAFTVEVDGRPVEDTWIADNSSMGPYAAMNSGPYEVIGGRHTISVRADRDGVVPESNENDNYWGDQWIWSPLPILFEQPMVRPSPPDPGTWMYWNSDGFAMERDPGNSWVVSVAANNEGDDYDLLVCDDYASSTSGFSNLIGVSAAPSNYTDFVLGYWAGTPTLVYPAVVLYSAEGGASHFSADQSDARNRNGNMSAASEIVWTEQSLSEYRLANVYDAYLESGVTYSLTLLPVGEDPHLSFEIFPPTPGAIYSRASGLFGSMSLPGGMEIGNFTPTESGWHPIVVYRRTGTGLQFGVAYDFHWRVATVDVPEEDSPAFTLAFHGVWPNPMTGHGRIVFDLSRPGPVSLKVFDLRGRLVSTVLETTLEAGPHSLTWDGQARSGARLGAGIYWMHFQAEDRSFVKRVVLLK